MKFLAFLVLKLYAEGLRKGQKTVCLQNKKTNDIEILGCILKKNSAMLEILLISYLFIYLLGQPIDLENFYEKIS